MSHGIHESPTSLCFPLDIVSDFRPNGPQRCGLEASVEELIHVKGLAVEFDERFIAVWLISGEQRGEGEIG